MALSSLGMVEANDETTKRPKIANASGVVLSFILKGFLEFLCPLIFNDELVNLTV